MSIVEELYRTNRNRKIMEYQRKRGPISMIKSIRDHSNQVSKALIVEFKRRSPSGFVSPAHENPSAYFSSIMSENVGGFSILTQPEYFGGEFSDIVPIQEYEIPILAKDFISSENMVESSYNAGADAILLISDFLPRQRLNKLAETAIEKEMEVLVEFHDQDNFPEINQRDCVMVGYNRRNLKNMKMEENPLAVRALGSYKGIRVLESGIDKDNFARVNKLDCDALLIGRSMLERNLIPGEL